MTPSQVPCGICRGDPNRRAFVNAELAKHTPHTKIEAMSKELGLNVKRETIRKHVTVCVPAAVKAMSFKEKEAQRARDWRAARAVERAGIAVPPPSSPSSSPPVPVALEGMPDTDDFAVLVREEAKRKLLAGELHVRVGDGIAAQALIDKREEKKRDRELIAQMGLLLARGSAPPPMIEEDSTAMINVTPDKVEVPV